MGRELRKLFIADDGCVLIDADYSQIELRLMAHLSGCKDLIAAFQEGQDIHRDTAAKVYGVSPIEVTDDMRRKAKAVNFGLIYGESAFGLAKSLKIKQSEAADFIERYFKAYPEIKEYQAKTVEFARQNGYATTIFGRKREFPELKSNNYAVRQFGERAAMNMPLQGTSADIIKLAMLSVYRRLQEKNMKTKLILQVHDELVLESPEEEAEEAASLLKDCMEHVVELSVPLTVEVGASRSWYDAK
jgi:DNA polymerase-1